ncbi:class I SAM-dependent methyltransferase [Paenibacillus chitinolyticus]|uniref:class I SAM-dependent methyltransferase n=1 Tax=Paenibacillus chitinolyticus TaxID=79263 RepID=UPI0036723014
MNIEVVEQADEILITLSEAFEYLTQLDNEGLALNSFLISDIKSGLEVLKNINLLNDEELVLLSNQLIYLCERYGTSNDVDFVDLYQSFLYWKYTYVLKLADETLSNNNNEKAVEYYSVLTESPSEDHQAVAFYRLAQMNQTSDPLLSFHFFKEAFKAKNTITKIFLNEEHPSYSYEYSETDELISAHCIFCEQKATPLYCAESYRGMSYNSIYSPIKVWMKCNSCNHIFAYNTPSILSRLKYDGINFRLMVPKLQFLNAIGDSMRELKPHTPGDKLLDVGIGGGELLAVGKELLFDVEGVEIVKMQAEYISDMLDVKVTACDFLEYTAKQNYDLITLGDVIEHIEDPVKTINKAYELLNDDGVLWISTPNFQSAFSQITKFNDPMWKEAGHLHYFSYHSLEKLLQNCKFKVINYKLSNRYNGSMEVTAVKTQV